MYREDDYPGRVGNKSPRILLFASFCWPIPSRMQTATRGILPIPGWHGNSGVKEEDRDEMMNSESYNSGLAQDPGVAFFRFRAQLPLGES